MTDARNAALDAAIEQHPQLWAAMVDAWRLQVAHGGWDPWANGQATGMVRALAIVGAFDLCVIQSRLDAATADAPVHAAEVNPDALDGLATA